MIHLPGDSNRERRADGEEWEEEEGSTGTIDTRKEKADDKDIGSSHRSDPDDTQHGSSRNRDRGQIYVWRQGIRCGQRKCGRKARLRKMTENEAKSIKWMKCVRDDAVVTLDNIAKNEPDVSPMLYAGRKEKAETIIKCFVELEQYREIGTVEECREARERQMPQKIIFNSEDDREYEDYICPNCKDILQQRRKGAKKITIYKFKFCHNCGQKLDWSDND